MSEFWNFHTLVAWNCPLSEFNRFLTEANVVMFVGRLRTPQVRSLIDKLLNLPLKITPETETSKTKNSRIPCGKGQMKYEKVFMRVRVSHRQTFPLFLIKRSWSRSVHQPNRSSREHSASQKFPRPNVLQIFESSLKRMSDLLLTKGRYCDNKLAIRKIECW